MPDLQAEKKELRAAVLAKRDALPAAARQAAAQTIAERGLPIDVSAGQIVSGFFPMKTEISPLPLLRKLQERGVRLALPVVAGRGKPLTMREWRQGDELASGVWGIREPKPDAPEVDPDILIVPLAVFDRRGYRVGYGAGYYDMTIARLRGRKPIVTVGIAFSVQEASSVPTEAHDERLDFMLTEREVFDFRNS